MEESIQIFECDESQTSIELLLSASEQSETPLAFEAEACIPYSKYKSSLGHVHLWVAINSQQTPWSIEAIQELQSSSDSAAQ